MKVYVSFDISSTVIGYAIFSSEEKKLLELSYYNFQSPTMLEKGVELEKFIQLFVNKYEIEYFIIEEKLKAFTQARTNAESMFKTAQMNFLSQFLFFKHNIKVEEIHVHSARGSAFPGFHKIAKNLKADHKDLAFEYSTRELGKDIFPTKVLKSGPRKGQTVFIEEAKDMSDAYILGKGFINSL